MTTLPVWNKSLSNRITLTWEDQEYQLAQCSRFCDEQLKPFIGLWYIHSSDNGIWFQSQGFKRYTGVDTKNLHLGFFPTIEAAQNSFYNLYLSDQSKTNECTCSINQLMMSGCKCGYLKK